MKRRFFPLEKQFRAITFAANNRVNLIALAAEGDSIYSFDPFEEDLKVLYTNSESKLTAIHVKNENILLIGTFTGEFITLDLNKNSPLAIVKVADNPIFAILDEKTFADSLGNLYIDGKLIVSDGILQPCRLLKTAEFIFFIKHRNIYVISTNIKTPNLIHLDANVSGVFCTAELDQNGNLIVSSDSGELFVLESPKYTNLRTLNTNEESEDEENDEAEESENAGVNVDEDSEDFKTKSERIFGLIQNPFSSTLSILKVDSIHKRAWLERIRSEISQIPTQSLPIFENVQISCPLCADKQSQSVPLNAKSCLKGHPITICSQTKTLLNSFECYRCRTCQMAYSDNPGSCKFCSGLITK